MIFFNQWTDQVKKNVPEDKLLVFDCKEGWDPLCKFLDVPVPNQPFPWENDTASIQNFFRRSMKFYEQAISTPIRAYLFLLTVGIIICFMYMTLYG